MRSMLVFIANLVCSMAGPSLIAQDEGLHGPFIIE
jgi:hypothetical protein